jgi:integrase
MAKLPATLLKAARKMGKPTVASAKLVRTALFVSLAQETALRAGNLVGIDLHKHLSLQQRCGRLPVADLVIPAGEVKNNVEISTRLTEQTAKLLQFWLNDYRCTQIAINCTTDWLFPKQKGGHRSVSQALEDVKDLSARFAGLDVTTHLMRAFVGKIILDEQPDGHAIVQQVLAHKSLKTTVQYYAPVRPAQARARYHGSLSRLRGKL